MAKVFKITADKDDNDLGNEDGIHEIIIIDEDGEEFKEMIFWLLENNIQYHFSEDETNECAIIVLKDDNVMAFKLRWA